MLQRFIPLLIYNTLTQWIAGVTVTFDDAIVIPINITSSTGVGQTPYYGETVVISSPSRNQRYHKSSLNKGKGKKRQRKSTKNIQRNDDGYYIIRRPSRNGNMKKITKSTANRNDDGYYVVVRPPVASKNNQKKNAKNKNNRDDDGYFVVIGPASSDTMVKKKNKSAQNRNDDGYIVVTRPEVNTDDVIVISQTAKPVSTDDVIVLPRFSPIHGISKDYEVGNGITKPKK